MSKKIFQILLMGFFLSVGVAPVKSQNVWRDKQLKNHRVKQAYRNYYWDLDSLLRSCHINPLCFDLYLQILKEQEMVNVYLKNKNVDTFSLFAIYDFCSTVGFLGPKQRQGDFQIPEGFYVLESFNPKSNYHLSLRVSYPNIADRIRNKSSNLGGDIMIHGGCATIGCIPIGDMMIEQLYLLATEAKNCGQDNVYIHIFPNEMSERNRLRIMKQYPAAQLHRFWYNMLPVYEYFKTHKKLPKIEVNSSGDYIISEQ